MFSGDSAGLLKRIVMPIALAILVLSSGCASNSLEIQSHWSVGVINVDGRRDDWADTLLTYIEDHQAGLGLRNDGENLHFVFRFRYRTRMRTIMLGGVTLWLDKTGEKKKDFGLHYVGRIPSEMERPRMGGEGRFPDRLSPHDMRDFMEKQERMAGKVAIIDKESSKVVIVDADGSVGPAVASADTLGIYTYEFSIPLGEKKESFYAVEAQPGDTIAVGLEWGGVGRGEYDRMRGGRGGGQRGGGRPDGTGSRGGGGRGGSMGGFRREPPKKQEIWLKIFLASPPTER